jgi:hypothetical protein
MAGQYPTLGSHVRINYTHFLAQTLEDDIVQYYNCRVSGNINGVSIQEQELHCYIVTADGRTYTAISRIAPDIGWDIQVCPVPNQEGRGTLRTLLVCTKMCKNLVRLRNVQKCPFWLLYAPQRRNKCPGTICKKWDHAEPGSLGTVGCTLSLTWCTVQGLELLVTVISWLSFIPNEETTVLGHPVHCKKGYSFSGPQQECH